MIKKEFKRTRHSNRVYPPKLCKKPDCNLEFIPTDARQIYCSKQHQIDSNNDKRKIVDSIEKDFTKAAKNNRRILIKILNSEEYKKRGCIDYSILRYEGYDFNVFHTVKFELKTKREVKFCYDYGIWLSDSEKNNYKIIKFENK
ncbi:hypothetical protein [Flavobacterium alvei]|uniref:hypothetical protein n=1 Tax=Flavobacterium alvei TaxID=2080416 RepID=UPI0026EB48CF|nr:hypothetical protein [Flavobacterium alvei]